MPETIYQNKKTRKKKRLQGNMTQQVKDKPLRRGVNGMKLLVMVSS